MLIDNTYIYSHKTISLVIPVPVDNIYTHIDMYIKIFLSL
jgi:hypothetical protein